MLQRGVQTPVPDSSEIQRNHKRALYQQCATDERNAISFVLPFVPASMLTQDDFDSLSQTRSYPHILGDPYPPLEEPARHILRCVPVLIEQGDAGADAAREIADTLLSLGIEPATFAEQMDRGSDGSVAVPTPDDSASQVSFDPDYTYQYENEGDVATIELAAQAETILHDPLTGWRVRADAGVVAGTHGELELVSGEENIATLDVERAVEWGEDSERPIIAGQRFSRLPVPAEIARDLRDDLWDLRTPRLDSGVLSNDPAAFPDELVDPHPSHGVTMKPFGWDPDRQIMWYDHQESPYLKAGAYQIESGNLIRRTKTPECRESELPNTPQSLIDEDDLQPVSR